jgi:RimJ/RimL family protein N-acetyltransferase
MSAKGKQKESKKKGGKYTHLLIGLLLALGTGGGLFMYSKREKVHALELAPPPVITFPSKFPSQQGVVYVHLFEKGDLRTETTCDITGDFPIYIERVTTHTSTGEHMNTSRIILRPLVAEDASLLYEVVIANSEHLNPFLPGIVTEYGETLKQTYQRLTQQNAYRKYMPGMNSVGIFFQENLESDPVFFGIVGTHSKNAHKKGSIEGMYWRRADIDLKGKGVITNAIQALFSHLVYKGDATTLGLVMKFENTASIAVAKGLGFVRIKPSSYTKWTYAERQGEVYVYTISGQKWMKNQAKHTRKRQHR